MALENVNYTAMLADMKAKRTALDASISALETALASGALGQPSDTSLLGSDGSAVPGGITGPIDLPKGALMGKSVPVAIKLYLEATKRKQKPQEIAAAISELGVESISKNFGIVVGTALKRLKAAGEVVIFKDGWGLSSWAPPSMRNPSQSSQTAKKKKKRSKGQRQRSEENAKPKPAKAAQEPEAKPAADASSAHSSRELVEGYFASRPGQEFSAGEIAKGLNLKVGPVNLICGALAKGGKIEKTINNKFRLVKVQQFAKAG